MLKADLPAESRSGMVLAFPFRETKAGAQLLQQGLAAENVLSCCRSILDGATDRLERDLVRLGDLTRQLPDIEARAVMEQRRRHIAVQLFVLRRMLVGL